MTGPDRPILVAPAAATEPRSTQSRIASAPSLMPAGRRYFVAAFFALLATPLVVGVFGPDATEAVLKEGRTPAAAPTTPRALSDVMALPGQVDAFLKDRFGLRKELIRLNAQINRQISGNSNRDVLIGRNGRMYLMQNEATRQSAGLVFRDREVKDTAEFLAGMKESLEKKGIRFLVASPPNTASIYPEDLPAWARNDGRTTEYDLFLAELRKRGVLAVDLRPALREARAGGESYLRYDSHWSPRGALAGFNAIAEADGHPEWRLDPAAVLGPPTVRSGGDLARMLAVQDAVSEKVQELTLPNGAGDMWTSKPYSSFAKTGDKPAGTVMVIGDSFTASSYPQFLLANVRKVIWAHHSLCGFDWQSIDRIRPDEVWWMPTERFLSCMPSAIAPEPAR